MKLGKLITFEGIDGSGKSTQILILAEKLIAAGNEVIVTREPGGSPGAEEIRNMVLKGDKGRWSTETELLLFTAARRDHLERVIEPAIAAGRHVLSDRYVDSTRVYQGVGRGELRRKVDILHTQMIGREADLTFVIDIEPEVGLDRAVARTGDEKRFESFGLELQDRLRRGFLDLARECSERVVLVDGNRPKDKVAADIHSVIKEMPL
ncbi:MAG: dTMP kinase [Roseovarius sp.]|nr:dTMP kinase [Roseovarius sp.]MCY4316147.1 dTMP kinase [Roseovarius sp.]